MRGDWEEAIYSHIPQCISGVKQEHANNQRKPPWVSKSNMAAAMRKLRCERLHWFLRRFSESGRSLTQGYVTRNTFSTSTCHLYSKSLPVMAKRRSETGTTQGFAKSQSLSHSFSRDVIGSKSRSKDSKYKREEKDLDSDPETESEDEKDMDDKSSKSKKKTSKGWKFMKLKSQKSGNLTLRPSRYLFKDFRLGEEEENRWERRYGLEDRKRKMNWYARQMLRLTREDKVRDVIQYTSGYTCTPDSVYMADYAFSKCMLCFFVCFCLWHLCTMPDLSYWLTKRGHSIFIPG